jgi:hypothetical protein
MKEINITYQSYIPAELITDFTELVQPIKVRKKEVKSGPWNHFDASTIPDIAIFINQHPTEFIVGIVGGIIGNAIWAGIILLWVSISKLPIKNFHSGGKQTDKKKRRFH